MRRGQPRASKPGRAVPSASTAVAPTQREIAHEAVLKNQSGLAGAVARRGTSAVLARPSPVHRDAPYQHEQLLKSLNVRNEL